ncbi:MAG: sulfurtransferase complex subunit TusC [Gammaproteobacteria bacterium]|nr:sulfurtransferase complex subunit TusC [Gammaproteobacteria bacterium]|tara:strand:+ start:4771 stop:5127 length:357 start_codon:yes stop_codon:yes gene_type:complete
MKTLTFLARSAPYGSSKAKALLDMVLSAAVFEQKIQYIFLDDGVYQLLAGQDPSSLAAKNVSAALPALELYGVDQVFLDLASLQARGLSTDQLLIPVTTCNAADISKMLAASDMVFSL